MTFRVYSHYGFVWVFDAAVQIVIMFKSSVRGQGTNQSVVLVSGRACATGVL